MEPAGGGADKPDTGRTPGPAGHPADRCLVSGRPAGGGGPVHGLPAESHDPALRGDGCHARSQSAGGACDRAGGVIRFPGVVGAGVYLPPPGVKEGHPSPGLRKPWVRTPGLPCFPPDCGGLRNFLRNPGCPLCARADPRKKCSIGLSTGYPAFDTVNADSIE